MNNSITVVGRIGQVPSSISFEDTGKQLVKFSVAVKEFSPNTDEEKTLWFDVNAWNGLGERALKTITKGREVVLNGAIELQKRNKRRGSGANQACNQANILPSLRKKTDRR